MKREIQAVAAGLATVTVGAAGAVLVGRSLWSRETSKAVARLARGTSAAPVRRYDPEELRGLPVPVRRYFEFALTPGQPMIRQAQIEHIGEFRADFDAGWSPFWSTEHFRVDPPGFVWDACIGMAPFGTVRVRDSYIDGEATMVGRFSGLVRVADRRGTRELASSALHRYLAESVWLPTALLPSAGVHWREVGDSSARATLVDSGIEASLVFHFSDTGRIARVTGERYRDVEGRSVLTPFVGEFGDYVESGGMRIPVEGEVEWVLAEGRLSYWMGRVVGARYDRESDGDERYGGRGDGDPDEPGALPGSD